MAIPVAATTISVTRIALLATDDPYDAVTASPETMAIGVRAVLAAPGGSRLLDGAAGQEDVAWRLDCDPVDIRAGDHVIDGAGGEYEVVWARQRMGFGVDHTVAEVRQVSGAGG